MQQVQGSGFWTDTWSSFFEMKNPTSKLDSSNETLNLESKLLDNSSRKDNAVLSQPHRASLFPSDSAQPVTSDSSKTENANMHLEKTISPDQECVNDKKNLGTSTLLQENQDAIVTLQPSNDALSSKHKDNFLMSPAIENSNKHSDINTEVIGSECDKNVSKSISAEDVLDNVPMSVTITSDSKNKSFDESQYISVHIPTDSSDAGQNVESVYDVIEMSDSDVSNNAMKNSSDSFTRSASVEIMTSMSQCSAYNISNSTVEIPNLPENMTQNLGSWVWNAVENMPPGMYMRQSESSDFVNNSISQSIQMLSSDTSFHTITASSFTNNPLWVKDEKSSHFVDKSQSSSEEQHSHHSDGSINSSKDDDDEDTDTAEIKEYDAKSSSSNGSGTTSSSSFVKCSADENDQNSHRGQSPISTTASERSDITKHESEQNTSGDENETATSSDIEILSPPNGENGDRNSSPLKHIWLPRPLRLRRSESPTSDSNKDSLMPVVNELEEVAGSSDKATASYNKGTSNFLMF